MLCILAGAILATTDTTLPNGVRIRTLPIPSSPVVSVQAFVRLGSVDDAKSGQAHLLEHILFRRNLVLDRKAEAAGGELIATTYREFMRFEFRGPKESLSIGLQCIESLLSQPSIDEQTLRLEKAVVHQEVALRATSTSARLWSKGADAPYSHPTIGNAVPETTVRELIDLHTKHFVGHSVVVVVSGDVADVRTTILGRLPKGNADAIPKPVLRSVIETNGWAIPAPGVDKLSEYVATVAAAELIARELSPGVTVEFGPSGAGSLAVIEAEKDSVAPLKQFLSQKLVDVTAVSERLAKRFTSPQDPSQAGLLHGLGMLFGNPNLSIGLAAAARGLKLSDVQSVIDGWSKVVGK